MFSRKPYPMVKGFKGYPLNETFKSIILFKKIKADLMKDFNNSIERMLWSGHSTEGTVHLERRWLNYES